MSFSSSLTFLIFVMERKAKPESAHEAVSKPGHSSQLMRRYLISVEGQEWKWDANLQARTQQPAHEAVSRWA